jgi:hypothetical protein
VSAGAAVQAAVIAALKARNEFAGVAVFDAPPVRAAVPYAVVDPPELRDVSAKGLTGRGGSIGVVLHDAGERPGRLRELVGVVAEVVEALSGELGGGWRATAVVLARERVARAAVRDRWMAMSEFAVRVWRVDG